MLLTCKDVAEHGSAYLDGELTRGQRWFVGAHLAICRSCKRYVGQLRATIAAMRDLEAPPIAPELRARVLAAFRKESGGSD